MGIFSFFGFDKTRNSQDPVIGIDSSLFCRGCIVIPTLISRKDHRTPILGSLASFPIFGLPLAIVFGILTILCLFLTALLGYFVLKGMYNIPFAWHMRMAGATIILAVVHAILVIAWLRG